MGVKLLKKRLGVTDVRCILPILRPRDILVSYLKTYSEILPIVSVLANTNISSNIPKSNFVNLFPPSLIIIFRLKLLCGNLTLTAMENSVLQNFR